MADMKYLDKLQEVLLERGFPLNIVQGVLETVHTIDAVEVVRCRECIHDGLPTCFTCYIEQHELIFLNHDPEFFCGVGERKGGDGNG